MTDSMTEKLRASLPHPPGLNVSYRFGKGRMWKSASAVDWEQEAVLFLRAAGFRPHPPGRYWVDVLAVLYTARHDVDASSKLILDTLAKALGIDDGAFARAGFVKVLTPADAQYLAVEVTVIPVADAAEWARLTQDCLDERRSDDQGTEPGVA